MEVEVDAEEEKKLLITYHCLFHNIGNKYVTIFV